MQGNRSARLELPAGTRGRYRLAQLDDYSGLKRSGFPWAPPVELSLTARVGSPAVPGTWGFGLWNAPMSFSLGLGRLSALPDLPNAAWFFHASDKSHLTFRDDLAGNGFLSQTFRSGTFPLHMLLAGLVISPFMLFQAAGRVIRRFIRRNLIEESGAEISELDATAAHRYRLLWQSDCVKFWVDGGLVHETALSPHPRLAIVVWIDNQYAGFTPAGRIKYGMHACEEPQWLEIDQVTVNGRQLEAGTPG